MNHYPIKNLVTLFIVLISINLMIITMSRAFIREGDDQWLSDIPPSLNALMSFLTKENNGIKIYEQKNITDANGREVYVMSNGLSYAKDKNGKWEVVE